MGNFQTSKSFNIRERQYRCLWLVIKIAGKPITTMGGISCVLRTEWNNICVANVSDQSARIYIHRIQFQILLQLTWRCCCYRLKSIIPNMRIPGGKIYGLWTLLFGKVFTSKFVGPGPLSYKKRIYRAVVSQRLRNTGLDALLYGGASQPQKWTHARPLHVPVH